MLFAPPPGYNPTMVNRQTVSPLSSPGIQGLAPLAFGGGAPGGVPPSSYSLPSSAGPAAATSKGPMGMGMGNPAMLLRALRGGGPQSHMGMKPRG